MEVFHITWFILFAHRFNTQRFMFDKETQTNVVHIYDWILPSYVDVHKTTRCQSASLSFGKFRKSSPNDLQFLQKMYCILLLSTSRKISPNNNLHKYLVTCFKENHFSEYLLSLQSLRKYNYFDDTMFDRQRCREPTVIKEVKHRFWRLLREIRSNLRRVTSNRSWKEYLRVWKFYNVSGEMARFPPFCFVEPYSPIMQLRL